MLLAWSLLVVWQAVAAFPWAPLTSFFNFSRFGAPALPDLLRHWGVTLLHLGLAAAWATGAAGLGHWVLESVFQPRGLTRLDRGLFSLGLGFNLWMLAIFFLAVFGGLKSGWFWPLWSLATGLGGWRLWRARKEFLPAKAWLLGSRPRLADRGLAVVVASFLGLVLWNANAPELFFDSLVYHLAVPAQWIVRGGMTPLPANFFSNLPMNMEMLYTGSLLLSDERLGRLLHAGISATAGLVVFSLGRRWFGRRTGWWAAGIYLTIPLLAMNMSETGIDGAAAFYALLACLALAHWLFPEPQAEDSELRRAGLAGWFAGAALGCKYSTVFLLGPAYISGLATAGFRQLTRRWRPLLIAGLASLALTLPWFVKSAVYTGNPVYPFLYRLIPSKHIDADKMQQQMDGFREFGQRTWRQIATLPWDMTFYLPTSNSFLGVVFLLLAPGLLWLAWNSRRGPPGLRFLLFAVAMAAAAWASQTQIMRYFLPALGLLAVLSAAVLAAAEAVGPIGRVLRWLALGLMVLAGGTLFNMMANHLDPAGVALGLEKPEIYLQRKLMNDYTTMARVVNQLPEPVHVLSVGETRAYYFRKPVTAATVYDADPFIRLLDAAASPEQAWQALRRQGFTHVYVNHQEGARIRGYEHYQWSSGALDRLRRLLAHYLIRVKDLGHQTLYAVAEQPNPEAVVKAGRPLFTYDYAVIPAVNDHLYRSHQAMGQRQWLSAAAELQRCLELTPEWGVPYQRLAWIYLQLNQPAEALAMFRQADRLGWLDAVSLNALGGLEFQAGRLAPAREAFAAAVREDSGFAQARQNLELVEHALAGKGRR